MAQWGAKRVWEGDGYVITTVAHVWTGGAFDPIKGNGPRIDDLMLLDIKGDDREAGYRRFLELQGEFKGQPYNTYERRRGTDRRGK